MCAHLAQTKADYEDSRLEDSLISKIKYIRRKEMNYSQFIEEIRKRTESRFEEGALVEVVRTERNNGTFLQGIIIRERQYNWAPTIYMEKFYMDYLNGIDIEIIMQEFIELYEEKRKVILPDMNFYNDYRKARERFSVKLIHYGKNREF